MATAKYKSVAASLIGINDGRGADVKVRLIKPLEVFECDDSEAAHHLARGRVELVPSPKASK